MDSLLSNKLKVSPLMISLPSAISGPTTYTLSLIWAGEAAPAARRTAAVAAASLVSYSVIHDPAAAMTVANGWYGSDHSISYVYEAVNAAFDRAEVAVDTTGSSKAELKVGHQLSLWVCGAPVIVVQRQPLACSCVCNGICTWQTFYTTACSLGTMLHSLLHRTPGSGSCQMASLEGEHQQMYWSGWCAEPQQIAVRHSTCYPSTHMLLLPLR